MKTIKLFVIVLLICSLLNLNILPANAKEIKYFFVDDDAKSSWYDQTHFNTIQKAIDASSNDDVIYVSNGNYFEKITINKSINLLGFDKTNIFRNETIKTNIISINSENVSISSFNIYYKNISEKTTGISIQGKNSKIDNCSFYKCGNGIIIKSDKNSVKDCHFYNNSVGIKIYTSNSTNISNSYFENNSRIGLIIEGSENSIIKKNNFLNNLYGISIESIILPSIPEEPNPPIIEAKYNTIYLCNFINNSNHTYFSVNTYENYFDNGSFGNYWDDYNGTDNNSDGIGDTKYDFKKYDFYDRFPLIEPYFKEEDSDEKGLKLNDIFYILLIGIVFSVIILIPIAYYFRKKILKL